MGAGERQKRTEALKPKNSCWWDHPEVSRSDSNAAAAGGLALNRIQRQGHPSAGQIQHSPTTPAQGSLHPQAASCCSRAQPVTLTSSACQQGLVLKTQPALPAPAGKLFTITPGTVCTKSSARTICDWLLPNPQTVASSRTGNILFFQGALSSTLALAMYRVPGLGRHKCSLSLFPPL